MKATAEHIRKKIATNAGFTLSELLIAILILGLVTAGLATSISLAVSNYQKSLRNSDAVTLCSTLTTIVSNELAFTTEFEYDQASGTLRFLSQDYAISHDWSSFLTDGDTSTGGYGHLMLGSPDEPEFAVPLLGGGSYPEGLRAQITNIGYNQNTHIFTVTLSIGEKGEEVHRCVFDVKNVNVHS